MVDDMATPSPVAMAQCQLTHTRPIYIMCMFIVISVIGILGNSFSIFLLAPKRKGRNKILSDTYRVYIIALAAADNGLLFFTGILRYVVIAWFYNPIEAGRWYEKYMCRWHRLFMHASHNASVWLLVVMALDRLVAVCFPFLYRELKHQPEKAKQVVVSVFVLSFGLATPFLAVGPIRRTITLNDVHTYLISLPSKDCGQNVSLCLNSGVPVMVPLNISETLVSPYDCLHPDRSSVESMVWPYLNTSRENSSDLQELLTPEFIDRHNIKLEIINGCSMAAYMTEDIAFVINIIFHIVLTFFLPYCVLILLNSAVFWKLNCDRTNDSASVGFNGRQRLNRRITVMMLAVCGTFVVLWLPQVLILLSHVDAHAHQCDDDSHISSLAALSGITNSALNFALYCLTVSKFRRAAAQSLRLTWLLGDEAGAGSSKAQSQYDNTAVSRWQWMLARVHSRRANAGPKPRNSSSIKKQEHQHEKHLWQTSPLNLESLIGDSASTRVVK